jgi:hypothetical protein
MGRLHRIGMLGLCSVFVTVAPAIGQQYCPWSAPVNLGPVVNTSTGDFFPFISKDGLSLYFSSTGHLASVVPTSGCPSGTAPPLPGIPRRI